MSRPRVRDDLALVEGYHSPQVSVDVRLNTNESPIAPPAAFTEQFTAAVAAIEWHRYPDRSASALRAKLASHYGVRADQVFVANGSNEVLQCLLLAYGGPGRRAAVFEPTYALHSHIARVVGTEVVVGPRTEQFDLDLDVVRDVITANRPEVVFLCSPNNPTGVVDPPETVRTVLDLTRGYGGLVIVDEAYGQFAPSSAVSLLDEDEALVVSRTFSKTWSLAALRLGYCIGPSWLIASLEGVALPYHLDAIKQLAGTIALDFRKEMDERVSFLVEERGRLVTELADLAVTVWPSGANFVLFRPEERWGAEVWQELVDRSVLVRNCASWPGLDGCLRVTVGTRREDDAFLAALADVLRPVAPSSFPGKESA